MKQIEFRVWDTKDRMFLFSDWKYGELSFWDTVLNDYEGRYSPREQFIGLSDLGQKLYEGDIVKFDVKKAGDNEPEIKNQIGEIVVHSIGNMTFGVWNSQFCYNIRYWSNIHQSTPANRKEK